MDKKTIRLILSRLEAMYGIAEWHPHLPPVDELVACILSQHTSDANSLRAFARLKERYAEWKDAAWAPVNDVADTIRCGGLADSKAPRIQKALQVINEREGALSLDCLQNMDNDEAREYLMSLPGVGPKTAAIVLCFSLNRSVIPVDTHIFRVTWRLGLVEKKAGEAKAHTTLQQLIPQDIIYRFHVALIRHGRGVCRARNPRCLECPVSPICRYYREQSL
jgi:endonuclease-3